MTTSPKPTRQIAVLAGLLALATAAMATQADAMNLVTHFNVTTTPHTLLQVQGRPPANGTGTYEPPPLHSYNPNDIADGLTVTSDSGHLGRIRYGTYKASPTTHSYNKNATPGGTMTSDGTLK